MSVPAMRHGPLDRLVSGGEDCLAAQQMLSTLPGRGENLTKLLTKNFTVNGWFPAAAFCYPETGKRRPGVPGKGDLSHGEPSSKSKDILSQTDQAALAGRRWLPRTLFCVVVLAVLVGLGVWLNQPREGEATAASQLVFTPARVTAVLSDNAVPDEANGEGRRVGTQELEIQLLSGPHKDEILPLTNHMSALFNVDVEEGDRVIVRLITQEDGSYYASMFNYDRDLVMGAALLVFCAVLALLGGWKGIRALLGLVFTLACVWFLLIPGLIRGLPGIPFTVAIASVTAAACLVLLDGFTKKSFCAVLGCVGGVAAAGIFAALVGVATPLNGFNMSEAENLILYGMEQGLHVSGLLVCGVLVAALGAVMDVSMSIASALWELRVNNPDLPARDLFRSGMNIGKDAMGTMANTLILAFAGSSLNTLLLVRVYDIPFAQLVNTDFICVEILQSVAGSMGILLTVPLVTAVSAKLMTAGRVQHSTKKPQRI